MNKRHYSVLRVTECIGAYLTFKLAFEVHKNDFIRDCGRYLYGVVEMF